MDKIIKPYERYIHMAMDDCGYKPDDCNWDSFRGQYGDELITWRFSDAVQLPANIINKLYVRRQIKRAIFMEVEDIEADVWFETQDNQIVRKEHICTPMD